MFRKRWMFLSLTAWHAKVQVNVTQRKPSVRYIHSPFPKNANWLVNKNTLIILIIHQQIKLPPPRGVILVDVLITLFVALSAKMENVFPSVTPFISRHKCKSSYKMFTKPLPDLLLLSYHCSKCRDSDLCLTLKGQTAQIQFVFMVCLHKAFIHDQKEKFLKLTSTVLSVQ